MINLDPNEIFQHQINQRLANRLTKLLVGVTSLVVNMESGAVAHEMYHLYFEELLGRAWKCQRANEWIELHIKVLEGCLTLLRKYPDPSALPQLVEAAKQRKVDELPDFLKGLLAPGQQQQPAPGMGRRGEC